MDNDRHGREWMNDAEFLQWMTDQRDRFWGLADQLQSALARIARRSNEIEIREIALDSMDDFLQKQDQSESS